MRRYLLLAIALASTALYGGSLDVRQDVVDGQAVSTVNDNFRRLDTNKLDKRQTNALIDDAVDTAVAAYSTGMKNRLINGAFAINQRSTNSATDDVYHVDRWYALTQTSSVTIAVGSLQENGQPTNLRMGQPGTAQRIGVAQIIEDDNSQDLRGSSVTLSARVRCSSSQAIRYAILESTQTPDTVTSDVVNSWTNTTFTAGQFFIAGIVVAGTGSTTPTANTWTSISLTATLSSDVDNIIVFFWTEGTLAQAGTLDIGKAQLEAGDTATAFERRPYGTELVLCQRHYQIYTQPPMRGAVTGGPTCARFGMVLPVVMSYAPTASMVGTLPVYDGAVTSTISSFSASYLSASVVEFDAGTSGLTAGRPCVVYQAGTAALTLSSEL